jgi:hypothetical protein
MLSTEPRTLRVFPTFRLLTALLCCIAICSRALAQQTDSSACKAPEARSTWMHNIFQQAWNSIQRSPEDTCGGDPEFEVLNARSEDMFKPFAGKYIRHIRLMNLGFERDFRDTTSRVRNFSTRLAQTLHVNTKDWVIRQNLFQEEGQRVDPYILADNERYFRSLDFLQDARILLRSVPGSPDSVDMLVVTKDLFSLKLVLDNEGTNTVKARISESNFLGMAQKIQPTLLLSQTRQPAFGYGFEYSKNNLGGSFAHVTVGYNNIDVGPGIGYEPESSTYLAIDRPLPSPYDHLAGALRLSTNRAMNVYRLADSVWYDYAYNIFDVWGGYNLSLDHVMKHDSGVRDRKFLSLRYFRQQFTNAPQWFETRFDPVYNNIEAVLAQFTFFRQEFIKTQYIYGFGITEDVPYGYNVSLTGGTWRQNDLVRPYAGITADYYTAHASGQFCQYYLRAGAMKNGKRLNDAAVMIGASRFARVIFSGTDVKIRPYFRATYARIFNPLTYEPLRLNNPFGLREFGSDSAQGFERLSFQTEATFFTRYKVYGFRLAPFVYADGAFLRGADEPFAKSGFYPSVGGGLRTRNENLIFGTIEARLSVFPRPVEGQPAIKFIIASDLQFRYRTTYIHKPDIVRLNSDEW